MWCDVGIYMWIMIVINYLVTKLQEKLNPIHGIINNFKCGTYTHNIGCNLMQKKASTSIQIWLRLDISTLRNWVLMIYGLVANEVLSTTSIDIQQSMFTLVMKSNVGDVMVKPLDANPLMGL